MTNKKRREDIRQSLLAQLAASGAAQPHFVDMVEDYMKLWDVKELQVADIQKRGVGFMDQSSRGFEAYKSNPVVKEMHGTNRQMLSIDSKFVKHEIAFGDNPLFRWAVFNTKMVRTGINRTTGNMTYGKIEEKSRKNDPFMVSNAGECHFKKQVTQARAK